MVRVLLRDAEFVKYLSILSTKLIFKLNFKHKGYKLPDFFVASKQNVELRIGLSLVAIILIG